MLKDNIIKTVKNRTSEGWSTAFIHLWGDSNRIRNFAGIWLKWDSGSYTMEFAGRLLGQYVFSTSRKFDDLERLADYAVLIWDSYK